MLAEPAVRLIVAASPVSTSASRPPEPWVSLWLPVAPHDADRGTRYYRS